MNGRTNSSDVTVTEVVVQEGVSIPLEAPTSFSGTSGDGTATITWTDPLNKYANPGGELVSDWSHDIVVRKQGSAPSSPSDGVQVLQTTSRDQVVSEPYVDSGLTNDQEYYYGIYAYNQFGLESEGLIGSMIPTSFGSIKYIGTRNTNIESGTQFKASNDIIGYICSMGEGADDTSDSDKKIDGNLVLSSFSHSPYYQFNKYAIIGNNTIIFGAVDHNTYDSYIIKIDGNSVISRIKSDSRINAAADVNHQAIYTETKTGSVLRYDSNLISSSATSTKSYSWDHASLSNKYYAMFTGYSSSAAGGLSHDYPNGYTYDLSGVRKEFSTNLCMGYSNATSNCDEFMLVFGGSRSTERDDSVECYGVSKDVVVQQLSPMPKDSFCAQYNIQGHKLGIVLYGSVSDNYGGSRSVGYYDKRLVFQGTVNTMPGNGPESQSIRVGNYVIFTSESDQVGYGKGEKYIAIYENP